MSDCVYTGARVLVEPYGMIVSADVHQVTDSSGVVTIIINYNPESRQYLHGMDYTHTITVSEGYLHKDKGVAVVPFYAFSGPRR